MAKENRLVILKNANKLFRQGKIDSAIKEYNKILGIKPNDLEVRRIIGDLQLKQNSTPGAVEQFEWIADYYLKEGFFAKAIAMYKRITRIDPNYEGVSVKLAELYTKQGLIIEAKQIYLDLAEENKRKNNHKKALDMYKKILEFDRNNIKMRLLLADNYLKEGLNDQAINEYMVATDILISKKDYQKAEELLTGTVRKVQSVRITEKLANVYIVQGQDQKAIELLRTMGAELFKHTNLLKLLGELYFKNNQIDEAEKIYQKITEISSGETEIIMRLGRVYLQRNEYDKTFQLFLPVVNKNIAEKKYEDATSLLRFIIASNNSYVPALQKLAAIFKEGGKKNNLIALYESMIPIYEQKEMKTELIQILEELIELSESSFTYQEQLARLTGKGMTSEEESEDEREKEFINFNLRVVQEAIKESDYNKAVDILKKTAEAFPNNLDVRLKLFDVHQLNNDIDALMEEGVFLLNLYKAKNRNEDFKKLLDKLYTLKPNDERLMEFTGEEHTAIDITFDKEELQDNMLEISDPSFKEIEMPAAGDEVKDVLLLSEDDSSSLPLDSVLEKSDKVSAPPSDSAPETDIEEKEDSKNLSSVFTELDFYINDGYFGDAERLIEELREAYPGNEELISRIQRLQKIRREGKDKDLPSAPPEVVEEAFDITGSLVEEEPVPAKPEVSKQDTQSGHTSKKHEEVKTLNDFADLEDMAFEIDMEEPEKTDDIPIVKVDKELLIQSPDVTTPKPVEEKELSSSDDLFELKDDKIIQVEPEMEEPERETGESSGAMDLIDFDKLLEDDKITAKPEPSVSFVEASDAGSGENPFQDIEQEDITYEDEEDLFKDDILLLDEDEFYENEKQVADELEACEFWLQELEKQRTSTMERNMMEIFDEFKKGVEEKIGQEDYETRYNLGIAYKEMGLVDEAIHEFLISSKHPLKFFDSAGLLGICFREKGMYDDAISWLEKAMESPDRGQEEYLSIKYELVLTYIKKDDYASAHATIEEIVAKNPRFRDIESIQQEVKKRL